jgi:hypothetical protein
MAFRMRLRSTPAGVAHDHRAQDVRPQAGRGARFNAEKIGIETTTYVRNVFKYYAAYKLKIEAHAMKATLKGQSAPAKN